MCDALRKMIKLKYILLILPLLFIASIAWGDDALVSQYDSAKEAYFNKDYAKAEKGFWELLEERPRNGYLLFNLGNVYFKMGRVGKAIQQYEKAVLTIPREMDLQVNLDYARKRLVDEVAETFSDYLNNTFFFWSSSINVSEYRLVLIIFSFFFWGYCLSLVIRKKRLVSTRIVISCLVFVYLIWGYVIKSDGEAPGEFGIILKPEVDVRASYLDKDKPLFQLHEGTKVRIIDSQDFGEDQRWLRVSLPQGQKGWVLAGDVGGI